MKFSILVMAAVPLECIFGRLVSQHEPFPPPRRKYPPRLSDPPEKVQPILYGFPFFDSSSVVPELLAPILFFPFFQLSQPGENSPAVTSIFGLLGPPGRLGEAFLFSRFSLESGNCPSFIFSPPFDIPWQTNCFSP